MLLQTTMLPSFVASFLAQRRHDTPTLQEPTTSNLGFGAISPDRGAGVGTPAALRPEQPALEVGTASRPEHQASSYTRGSVPPHTKPPILRPVGPDQIRRDQRNHAELHWPAAGRHWPIVLPCPHVRPRAGTVRQRRQRGAGRKRHDHGAGQSQQWPR